MDKEYIALLVLMGVMFVCMFGYYVVNEKQQTQQMKACVAAGKTWERTGDAGDCK